MKTIGFPISHKENENRRAIVLQELEKTKYPHQFYFEDGYGDILGISNNDIIQLGCHICSRQEVLKKDIICDPKVGDADYLSLLKSNQTIFGWIHATQNKDITDAIVDSRLTAYAWEKMYESGRHVFWRNNELAGEAAVMHAFQCFGMMPYECNVAVLGRGNTARGAIKVLNMLGAQVAQYDRKTEDLFVKEIGSYDVIVNCILWDVNRNDHIINRSDLKRMKKNSMIIDVSCDRSGGIETSIPTTIENPTYVVDGIVHYVVDHTPSLFYKTFSRENSKIILPFLEELLENNISKTLKDALIIENGIIVDKEILIHQKRVLV